MKRITLLAATTLAALTLLTTPANAVLGGTAGPYTAHPQLSFQVHNSVYTVPTAAQATNMRQANDRTPIVISSTTPAVCTVPANSASVGTYQRTPWVPITLVGKGTCTIRATQAAFGDYLAGLTERSYTIR